MIVRAVRREDNDQLIALSRSSAMSGEMAIQIDRSPDFFAYYDKCGPCLDEPALKGIDPQRDDGWLAACAEMDGRIVGVGAVMMRRLNYAGETIRVALLSDARVAPEHQRQGVGRGLAHFLYDTQGTIRHDLCVGIIASGNTASEGLTTRGMTDIHVGEHAGDFLMVTLSMYRPYRKSRLTVERATDADVPEVVDVLAEFCGPYHFTPVFDEPTWRAMLAHKPGLCHA